MWDIGQSSGKNPISTLECLVSHYDDPVWISASKCFLMLNLDIFQGGVGSSV